VLGVRSCYRTGRAPVERGATARSPAPGGLLDCPP
jgi:hypothetical protein